MSVFKSRYPNRFEVRETNNMLGLARVSDKLGDIRWPKKKIIEMESTDFNNKELYAKKVINNDYKNYFHKDPYNEMKVAVKRGLTKTTACIAFKGCVAIVEKQMSELRVYYSDTCTPEEKDAIEKEIPKLDLDTYLEKGIKYVKKAVEAYREFKDAVNVGIGVSLITAGILTQNPILTKKGLKTLLW